MSSASQPFEIRRTRSSLFKALLEARARHGGSKVILVDGDERKMTFDEVVRAAFGLGHALKRGTQKGENVGVLLPTGAGAVITFFALHAYGRVPAMLNFTAGGKAIKAALKAARVKRVLTAHRFIDIAKLEGLIDELKDEAEIVYLEDVREKLGLMDKVAGGLGPIAPWLFKASPRHEDAGVILFTSGTEGEPKGVVLTHQNVLANVEQVRAHIDIFDTDVLFNPLPTFHCFGLTVGAILPVMLGVRTVMHPSPLQAQTIAKRVRESGATILLATDTFMSQYARAGDQGDLDSLRIAVCGAERVKDETRAYVKKKYNIELLEGYGATEAAPVVAANKVGANKPGTVGLLMPGMESKLEPVEGITEGGRLLIRGPNIMAGYMRASNPGVIEPPKDGWHDTGDIVTIDAEGYIAIRGRLKRFAKIAGEMVSLAVVENVASAVWQDDAHAAVAVPDGRKGEQIILLTTHKDAKREDLLVWAKNHGVPELAVPKKIVLVEAVPLLGTGKTDYGRAQKLAEEQLQQAA